MSYKLVESKCCEKRLVKHVSHVEELLARWKQCLGLVTHYTSLIAKRLNSPESNCGPLLENAMFRMLCPGTVLLCRQILLNWFSTPSYQLESEPWIFIRFIVVKIFDLKGWLSGSVRDFQVKSWNDISRWLNTASFWALERLFLTFSGSRLVCIALTGICFNSFRTFFSWRLGIYL